MVNKLKQAEKEMTCDPVKRYCTTHSTQVPRQITIPLLHKLILLKISCRKEQNQLTGAPQLYQWQNKMGTSGYVSI